MMEEFAWSNVKSSGVKDYVSMRLNDTDPINAAKAVSESK